MRRVVVTLLVLAACAGTPKQQRRRAEFAIGGSLAGLMASGLTMAAWPGGKPYLIPIAIGFGGLAIASTVLYGVAHSRVEVEPPPPAAPPKPNPAWPLTQQAQAAAREGKCDEVKDLDARVKDIDGDFHAIVFARDVAIQRCLAD